MCITVTNTSIEVTCRDRKHECKRELPCIKVQFACDNIVKFRLIIESVVLLNEEKQKYTYYHRGMNKWHRIYTNSPQMDFCFMPPDNNDAYISDGSRFYLVIREKHQNPQRYTFEMQNKKWVVINIEVWTQRIRAPKSTKKQETH